MAKLKDTEIDGNLYVSEDIQVNGDIQIGNASVLDAIETCAKIDAENTITTVPLNKIVELNDSVIDITSGLVHQVGKVLNVNIILKINSTRSAGIIHIQGYKPIDNQMLLAVKDDTKTVYACYIQEGTKYILPYDALPAGTYRLTGTLILE